MKSSVLPFILAALLVAPPFAMAQYSAGETGNEQPEFHLMGFGDLSYVSADGTSADGFVIGQGVAHLSAALSESLGVFGEFSATARDSEYSFEIERLIVKYDFSDRFKLSAGRYHTPIGYWNSAFHHGAWLQTSVLRPEMVKFGSRVVPIHFVGILLEGNLPSTELGLNYKAGLGNGRHSNIARAGDAGDVNGDRAWMLQIGARPRALRNLDLGIGYYTDEISLPGEPEIGEETVSAHAAWTRERPEIIVEYLHSEHDSALSTGGVDAWYAQFAWRLPGERSEWKPYARLESIDVDATDPLLAAIEPDYDAGILGLRWDFNHYAALKGEYRNEEFGNNGREHNVRLQLAFVLTRL
ncbi:MAG: hypothetical protein ACREQZ_12365 [Woeseiaceae bacterium]